MAHAAPEVTLEGAGIFVTGAYQFGVPNPTGHPLWVLFGYLWCHVIVPFGNPAWRIATMSVFTGGLLVGVLAFMMIRSTRMLLQPVSAAREDAALQNWAKFATELEGERPREPLQRWIATTVGVGTALLFGFSRGVWPWACDPGSVDSERLCFRPAGMRLLPVGGAAGRKRYLYATLLVFGASAADHHSVFVMAGVLLVRVLVAGVSRFRPLMSPRATARRFPPSASSVFWETAAAALFVRRQDT